MQPIISVIIPVYNVESYLKKCIESVLGQTLSNIEIILINDGSTDHTQEICEELTRLDSRITLLTQDNNGVSLARKRGVLHAKGDYIVFLDGDDYLNLDYCEQLLKLGEECDGVIASYCKVYKNEKVELHNRIPKGKYDRDNKWSYFCTNFLVSENKFGIEPGIAGKLFKRELIRGVMDSVPLTLFWGEDKAMVYLYILRCHSLVVSDYAGYNYVMRETSTTHSYHETFLQNINEWYLFLKAQFNNSEYHKELLEQLQVLMAREISKATQIMGFEVRAQSVNYIFPYMNLLISKRVVLYGAGRVGRDYYNQIIRYEQCDLIGWVDEEKCNSDSRVEPIEMMETKVFDFVVIAVLHEELADAIKNNLMKRDIAENKILWAPPYSVSP